MTYELTVVYGSTDGTIANGTEISGYTLNAISLQHGRQSIDDVARPSAGQFTLLWNQSGAPSLATFIIGLRWQVFATIDGHPSDPQCLFDGAITDVIAGRDYVSITAITRPLAEIGRQTVANPSQIEATSSSAFTTLYNLGDQDDRLGTVSGSTAVRVPAFDNLNLLQVLTEVAASEIGGYVTQTMPWGPTAVATTYGPEVITSNVTSRSQLTADITFTAGEIIDQWNLARRVEDLINRVTVKGTADGTDFPDGLWTETYQPGVDTYGLAERLIATRIRYENDAEGLAEDKLQRYYVNGWVLEQLTIPLHTMTAGRLWTVIQNLGPDQLITIPALFTGAPTQFFIEGINFRLSSATWDAVLWISTAGFSRGAQKWEQVTPTLVWSSVDATTTWADLRLIEL
jgi:hypothetical protein